MQAFFYQTIDSTNEQAKRLIMQQQVKELAYLMAEGQYAGRGTRGRSWVSPAGAGLYLSIIHPNINKPLTTRYTQAAAIGVAEALDRFLNVHVRIKPVNDLYVNGCKLGGILTEATVKGNRLDSLITGVGLNLRTVPRVLPEGAATPIALDALMTDVESLDTVRLAETMVELVDSWYRRIEDEAVLHEVYEQWVNA
jgi:biotin-[acetyl-CoA-carboxylase] ligase BirA-like protein